MAFNTRSENFLEIDISDLNDLIHEVKRMHTPENYRKVIIRAFRRAERARDGCRRTISQGIRKEYNVTDSWIRSQIKYARIGFGSSTDGEVHCSIPISGTRGWHGRQFKLTNANNRGIPKNFTGKRYKIYSRVYKNKGPSELPAVMKNMGGQPPFISTTSQKKGAERNQLAENLNGAVMTRRGKSRLPIDKVVGIGVPQMPMNKSRDYIQARFIEVLAERIEHEHKYMMQQIAKRAGR